MKFSNYNVFRRINGNPYVYNSVTKAFLRVSDTALPFEDSTLTNVEQFFQEDDLTVLIENGFVVEDNFDELKALEFIYKKSFFNATDLTLILTPTFECNFACPYCFEAPQRGANTTVPQRATKTVERYFSSLEKYAKKHFHLYRHVELSLFGGEPLLLFENFSNFLNYTKALSEEQRFSYSTSITTNGSLLNKDVVHTLVQHHCRSLQITIDGGIDSHNKTRAFKGSGAPSFDLLMHIINHDLAEYYEQENATFYLRINLQNNGVDEIRNALSHVDEAIRHYVTVIIRAVYSTECYHEQNTNSVEDLMEYYNMAAELGFRVSTNGYFNRSCEACCDEGVYFLTPDLGVWKCVNTMSLQNGKVGDITENGDLEIDAAKMIDWYKAADCFSDSKCLNCKLLPDCFGGCILFNSVNGKRLCTPFDMTGLSYFYE